MVFTLNEADWDELCISTQLQGETIYQRTTAGMQFNLPHQIGKGGEQTIHLQHGLTLSIR